MAIGDREADYKAFADVAPTAELNATQQQARKVAGDLYRLGKAVLALGRDADRVVPVARTAPGSLIVVSELGDGTLPDRPTSRSDVTVAWASKADPAAAGKALAGVDKWWKRP